MLTDEFLDMCYDEYSVQDSDMEFHEYVDKQLQELQQFLDSLKIAPPGRVSGSKI